MLSLPAASLFDEPRLSSVICAMALASVMDGAQNIGIVDFRKNLEFRKEFTFTTMRKAVSVVVAVTTAWLFRSYWALAAGILTSSVVGLVASFFMHAYRPRLSLAASGKLLAFSKWLMVDNLVQFLRTRSSDLLIGKLVGAGPLGLFNLAQETATLAQATVTAPINRALLPGYSRLQNDLQALRESYFATVGITTLVSVPMAVGIASVAQLLVPLLLGNRWLASIPLIQLLGLASAVSLCGSGAPIVYVALGRPKLGALMGAAEISILLTSMAILLPRFGATGAALATLITALVILPLRLKLAHSVLGSVLRRWVGAVWRPVLAATVMYSFLAMLGADTDASLATGTQIARLSKSVGVGICVYASAIVLLWWFAGRPPGAETTIAVTVGRLLSRSRWALDP
jgi:O-antigen/teichoic acid export membrane protein